MADQTQGFVPGVGTQDQSSADGFVPTKSDTGHPLYPASTAQAQKTGYGDVMLGNAPATDLPLAKPGQWDDILAPTERGAANVIGGTTQAIKGVYNLVRHPVDTAKGVAKFPGMAGQVPQAIKDISAAPDPVQKYAEVAENTAGQGAGQAITALGMAAAPKAVPPLIRAGATALERTTPSLLAKGAGAGIGAGVGTIKLPVGGTIGGGYIGERIGGALAKLFLDNPDKPIANLPKARVLGSENLITPEQAGQIMPKGQPLTPSDIEGMGLERLKVVQPGGKTLDIAEHINSPKAQAEGILRDISQVEKSTIPPPRMAAGQSPLTETPARMGEAPATRSMGSFIRDTRNNPGSKFSAGQVRIIDEPAPTKVSPEESGRLAEQEIAKLKSRSTETAKPGRENVEQAEREHAEGAKIKETKDIPESTHRQVIHALSDPKNAVEFYKKPQGLEALTRLKGLGHDELQFTLRDKFGIDTTGQSLSRSGEANVLKTKAIELLLDQHSPAEILKKLGEK